MQHHRGSNNNPKLQPLLGWWDREGEAGEGEGMKMERGHGLRPCHGEGVELVMGLSACMESGGNGGDVSPEGGWVSRSCQSMQARWVLR